MALFGNLRDYRFPQEADDIRGADIYGGKDEKLGIISDVIFEHHNGDLGYLVVDTGGWLSSHKFLVPARSVMTSVEGEDHFHVNLSKEQIERFPAYNEQHLDDEKQWSEYETQYKAAHPLSGGPGPAKVDSSLLRPRRDPARNEERRRFGTRGVTEQPVTMSPAEFLKDGTLRWEYDAPGDGEFLGDENFAALESGDGRVPNATGDARDEPIHRLGSGHLESGHLESGHLESGSDRFRRFQDKLRQERAEILRRRQDRAA